MGRLGRTVLIGGLRRGDGAWLAACSSDDGGADGTTTTAPRAPVVGLDEIQVLAAHNAYHLEGEEALLAGHHGQPPGPDAHDRVLAPHPHRAARPRACAPWSSTCSRTPTAVATPRPRRRRCSGLEPDRPGDAGARLQGVPHPGGRLPLDLPHLRAPASRSSRRGPTPTRTHLPIIVQIEAKDGAIPDPLDLGFVQPIPVSEGTFTALEAEILSRARRGAARDGGRRAGRPRHAARRHRGRGLARRRRPPRPVRLHARRHEPEARHVPGACTPTPATG